MHVVKAISYSAGNPQSSTPVQWFCLFYCKRLNGDEDVFGEASEESRSVEGDADVGDIGETDISMLKA
ncbi:hypothetical protein HPP92_007390 [Vanilla planifolia]|uniref:Uncharacterized protein n=1 Tax=Vanilla planifolia TaxID=51239 RepID=A0A835RAQ6_VANPL|nr:hypothetical protein HPP92_007576 [Vanilla planifolia]KAG0490527.1 hypothetical protein HPP92_007390 [Vanilla planifolia]